MFFAPKFSENIFFITNNHHVWEEKIIYSPQTTTISEECSMYSLPQKYQHVSALLIWSNEYKLVELFNNIITINHVGSNEYKPVGFLITQ